MIKRWIDVSPPLANRARKSWPQLIVLHATAGASAESSISHLRKVGLSYHYIIERDGAVYICVPRDRVAFHVGTGVGPKLVNSHVTMANGVNDRSIGVCLANRQNGEKYTLEQIAACHQLCADLARKAPTMKWITTHAVIQWWNRSDPARWDLAESAKASGLEVWTTRPPKP